MPPLTAPSSSPPPRPSAPGLRLGLLAALGLLLAAELGGLGVIFKHAIPFHCIDNWPVRACQSASLTLVALYCVLGALGLCAMLRPAPFRALLGQARLRALPLGLNLLGLGLALVPLSFLVNGAPVSTVLPAFGFWGLGMGLILGGLGRLIAPLPAWRRFLGAAGSALGPAIAAGIAAPWLAVLIRPLWGGLDGIASATFSAVAWIIAALGYEVYSDPEAKVIGAGEFYISVAPQCSGVEGFALVTLFVSLYLWLFRADLRFPGALLLYPLGLAASAAFNVVRITVLLVIGLGGNPELAVGGFHSHAGWLMFTLVALGIIALAQSLPWLRRGALASGAADNAHAAPGGPLPFWQDPVAARILPFAVFMLSALLASALSGAPGQVYPLRALVVAAVMAPFWGIYRALGWRLDPAALTAGLGIAALWVLVPVSVSAASAPPYGTLTDGMLLLWLLARGIGTTLLVPVLEELFFRDYLEGLFRRGRTLPWTIGAALASAGLFALFHDRWAEAFAAGLVFSWLAARPGGRISDAILAHGLANGLIFAVALATNRLEII